MRILITGKNGQLGNMLVNQLAPLGEVIAVGSSDCDLRNSAAIINLMEKIKPSIVINPAAYTAVDKAESDRENAFAVNSFAPKILANQANLQNIPIVHYSTDYVFDGAKTESYLETDMTNPQSIYGLSKCLGEKNVRTANNKHLILRTSWVYGSHGNNFLKTILRLAHEKNELKIINDQFGVPTSTRLLAFITYMFVEQLLHRKQINSDLYGTYHLVPDGRITWFQFAQKIISHAKYLGFKDLVDINCVLPIVTEQYPLPAKRPKNSTMNNNKIKNRLAIAMPNWEKDVELVLNDLLMRSC